MGSEGLMIRNAGLEDIAHLVELVGRYREEVRPDLPFHKGAVASMVRSLISQPRGCVLVSEDQGAAGVLIGHCGPSLWWPDLSAEMLLWWVGKDARDGLLASALFAAFEDWAIQSGAARIAAIYTGKDAGSYFKRRGFRHADTRMMKDLS